MPELLLEIFSEEIPARMQQRAARDLERAVNARLMDAGFMPEGVKGFAAPRRLAVVATGIPARQPDRREEKKGPRVGAPEKAIEGFLKSAGLSSLDDCEQREDKKGAYYVAAIDRKGRETAQLIAEFLPDVIRNFSWPKSMRWGPLSCDDGALRWVRPVHRILCAFDGDVVDFEIDGVRSDDKTEGHRFMAPEDIQARSFDNYVSKLRAAKVVLDARERMASIANDAATLAQAQGLELVEDAGLLNEVAGLAEWPVVMIGSFDEKFLTLPDEVLTASMRGHQKYFSVKDPQTGRLANRFVFVANLEAPDGGAAMRVGYERVLTARLSDAWYLYRQDLKTPLADRIADLDAVTFFQGLGSVGDKARRIAALAREIAPAVGADPETAARAGRLAKADLVSGMVYEFPELQGVMGRYYYLEESGFSSPACGEDVAEGDGGGAADSIAAKTPSVPPGLRPGGTAPPPAGEQEAAQIADAVRDHYKPAGQDDAVPTAPVSVAVALADKIDTLTAFWAIGKKPTGSSDPFALRRAALGVIAIILKGEFRIPISPIKNLKQPFDIGWEVRKNNNRYELLRTSNINRNTHEKIDFSGDLVLSWRESENDVLFQLKDQNRDYSFNELLNEGWRVNDTLVAFFHDRLKVYLRDKGHRYDHIDAVLADADGNLQDDLVLIVRKLEALEAFLKTDDGENLAAAYKRAANILNAEKKKKALPDALVVNEGAFEAAAEKALYKALMRAEKDAAKAVAKENFETAMSALASLRAPLDAFFDTVTVNADDAKLRANRLSLLARLIAATAGVADFSKLEG